MDTPEHEQPEIDPSELVASLRYQAEEEDDDIRRARHCAQTNHPQTACAFALVSIAESLKRIALLQEMQ